MATSRTSDRMLTGSTIVDADVHVGFTEAGIAAYCEDTRTKRALENLATTDVRSYRPSGGWDTYLGGKIEGGEPIPDAEATDEHLCRGFGVDHPICNILAGLSSISDTDLARHMQTACNDLLLDRFLDEKAHFYGVASIAPQDPAAAAEEIDRLGDEDQICGIMLYSTFGGPPLGDPKYDPIYAAAEDNDLAVTYHGSATYGFVSQFPIQDNNLESFLSVHTLTHPFSSMVLLCSFVEHGTFVKFPDLNFVILEAGVGWVPYAMYRLNKEYSIRRGEAPMLERQPEDYIRESMYFASQPIGEPNDPTHMTQLIEMVGTDSVMFASDYPHWDFDQPDAIDKHLRSLPEADRERVLSGTPAEAFGLAL